MGKWSDSKLWCGQAKKNHVNQQHIQILLFKATLKFGKFLKFGKNSFGNPNLNLISSFCVDREKYFTFLNLDEKAF